MLMVDKSADDAVSIIRQKRRNLSIDKYRRNENATPGRTNIYTQVLAGFIRQKSLVMPANARVVIVLFRAGGAD